MLAIWQAAGHSAVVMKAAASVAAAPMLLLLLLLSTLTYGSICRWLKRYLGLELMSAYLRLQVHSRDRPGVFERIVFV